MLKHLGKWTSNSVTLFLHPTTFPCRQTIHTASTHISSSSELLKIRLKRAFETTCRARRRRVIYYDNEDDEEYGQNEELAMLEMYTQLVKDELLLVRALVDDEEVEVVIFKGFSSCLSYETSPDPSRSVLPAKAVIKSIDRAKGPFDPSNVQYIEKGLSLDAFKNRPPQQN